MKNSRAIDILSKKGVYQFLRMMRLSGIALITIFLTMGAVKNVHATGLNGQMKQGITIKGVVKDADGESMPGVNVLLKGTTTGVVTGADGEYTITVPNENAVLVYSFIGYQSQELVVGINRNIDVSLDESSTALDEVVVTALGIKRDAKALGYAVSKVGNDRIMASGTPANALQSLYGSAAGVQVAATAAGPSGGMKINIRNAVSFDKNSTTRPLIVVDGVPIHDENTEIDYGSTSRDNGTGINDINPDDIASLEILKGAKASVLYGSEGANGVILITTKSGAQSKGLGVSASFTNTWDFAAYMPDLQREYGTGRSASNAATDDQGFYINANNQRALDYMGAAFGPKFDPSVKLIWWDGVERAWEPQTKNIYDDIFRQGRQTTTNIALSSSNDNGSIRFSYTNMYLTPIRPTGKYTKNTFSLSASYKLNDHISLKYTGNFYISENMNAAYAGSMDAQGSRTDLGAYSADINVDLLRSYMVTPDGYSYFDNPSRRNLISNGRRSLVDFFWDQEQNLSEYNRLHNIQSVTADLKINKTFGATIMGGMDYSSDRNKFKGKLLDPSLIGPTSGSSYSDKTRIFRNTYGQGMINFNTQVSDFSILGFVGGAIKSNYFEQKGASVGGGMVIPNFFSFSNLASGVNPTYENDNGEDILYSLLGSAQVAWKNQIYLELQARQDWSSILPPDNNSYFYPGVSATWILTEGLELPQLIEFAKVRASWADVGRPGPRYFSNVNYEVKQSGAGYILTPPEDLPPMDANGVPNLKPERKREFEFGLETYLFEGQRIGVDLSLYTSNTYDQIMAVTAPAGLGVKNIRMNAGKVSNRGWELALKGKPVYTRDFKWDLGLTISGSKTRVEKLDGKLTSLSLWGTNGLNCVAEVGGEYGLIYQQKGFHNYTNPSDPNDPNNGKRVVNSTGSSYDYSSASSKVIGKLLPDVIGGLFSSFEYKNLRLIFNIDYSFGAIFISETETYMMAAGVLKETLQYRDTEHGGIDYYKQGDNFVAGVNPNGVTYHDGVMLDGVSSSGVTNDKVVPAETYYSDSYFSNGFFPEDRIFKSDYIALRNVAIDYTIPYRYSKKIGMSNLVLSVFANNLAYIYKAAPNSVPESSNGTGWNNSSYGTTAMPTQRSIGFSIKVNF